MKKFAHLEGGIDTWDDFNNDYKLRVDAHKNGLEGYLSPSDHEPTDEDCRRRKNANELAKKFIEEINRLASDPENWYD